MRKCPTCSLYDQITLPTGRNPKDTQRNYIWQVYGFHFTEFGKLKYVYHTIESYSGFQWETALSSENKCDDTFIKGYHHYGNTCTN